MRTALPALGRAGVRSASTHVGGAGTRAGLRRRTRSAAQRSATAVRNITAVHAECVAGGRCAAAHVLDSPSAAARGRRARTALQRRATAVGDAAAVLAERLARVGHARSRTAPIRTSAAAEVGIRASATGQASAASVRNRSAVRVQCITAFRHAAANIATAASVGRGTRAAIDVATTTIGDGATLRAEAGAGFRRATADVLDPAATADLGQVARPAMENVATAIGDDSARAPERRACRGSAGLRTAAVRATTTTGLASRAAAAIHGVAAPVRKDPAGCGQLFAGERAAAVGRDSGIRAGCFALQIIQGAGKRAACEASENEQRRCEQRGQLGARPHVDRKLTTTVRAQPRPSMRFRARTSAVLSIPSDRKIFRSCVSSKIR